MVENGRKIVHRGYLVGNGFPRVLRQSPTTFEVRLILPSAVSIGTGSTEVTLTTVTLVLIPMRLVRNVDMFVEAIYSFLYIVWRRLVLFVYFACKNDFAYIHSCECVKNSINEISTNEAMQSKP